METKIVNETENPLFSRKEVIIDVKDNLTPSKDAARKLIAEKFKADESLIRVKKITSKFGSNTFTIYADIYKSLEEFKRLVKKTKKEIEAESKTQ